MLDHRGPGRPQLQILECQDVETATHGLAKLAGAQQMIGIAWLAESFIALGEGLVEQQPARRHRTDDIGEDRPVEVVGHHHQIEPPVAQGPRAAILEIGVDLGQARGIRLLVGIAVQRRDLEAMGEQELAMPAASGRKVEGGLAAAEQWQEAENPGGGRL